MEKNLPFVSLSFVDKAYAKLIIPFLGKLDDGNVFKNIITFLLSLTAIALLLGGIYLAIVGLFGYEGYIKSYITNEGISGGKQFGAIIGLVLGFSISILTAWTLYSILKKRTEQLNEQVYLGLLDFVFNKTLPKLILILGELLFILFIYGGILQIIATMVGSYVYAPLSSYPGLILGLIPGTRMFNELIPNSIYGDYDNIGNSIKIAVMGIASSFVILIVFYIYKEIYSYLLKLITVFIGFLPKFAIPLAIRKRNEN